MELNQYLSMFIDESTEHLQSINEKLLELEQSPDNLDIVNVIFRSAHTLKGMAATMGFEDLASLTHQMENVLDLVRGGKLTVDSFIFDGLFKSTDALEAMLSDIIAGGTGKADVSGIVAVLKSIVSGEYKEAVGAAAAASEGASGEDAVALDQFQLSVLEQSLDSEFQVYFIRTELTEECVLRAARAYMVFRQLEDNGEIIKSFPSVEDIEQDKFDRAFSLYYVSKLPQEAIVHLIEDISEIRSATVTPLDHDSLRLITQPILTAAETAATAAAPVKREETAAAAKTAPASSGHAVANRTIRVDLDRLDHLMNLFSELLIDRVRLEQLASEIRRSDLTETVEHMSRVSSDLQNIVLNLRMVPIDTVFNRFPRMIRDVAKTLGKKLELVISGAETELDRTVVDEIGDPLVHLLRNSADHGIETIENRKKAGKDETGTIQLRAYHSGNHVIIEVSDDGAGINRAKTLAAAIKKGVVTEEAAERMSDEEVYRLLFASGFSTAEKISDLSGRGVGLDVVKTKIESLGGQIHITSKEGVGTTFSVNLPLTLSIIGAMLIEIGSEKYAIPLNSIVETAAVDMNKIRRIHGNDHLDYRGSVIPVIDLGTVLDVPGYQPADSGELNLVIIRKREKLAALIVSDFIGQQEIVLKNLGKYLSKVFAVSGATILGDGQVALIINPNALIK
ncbi:chemotaxis protein CheA [Gorillibacterium timonense]|uniref:chemotaxis protein CheA n=1 Tax=Gorillibacterium timonense TaxID=1689269 RepID=UPI00071D278F|nr:chemotaxis protein CheA [Gorillibacterium timonense]